VKHSETSDIGATLISSTTVNQVTALALIRIYKQRSAKKSWRSVFLDIEKEGSKDLFAISPQKLVNWDSRNRKTPLNDRAFSVVVSFIHTDLFQSAVPEAKNYIHQKMRTIEAGVICAQLDGRKQANDIEEVILEGLKGLWVNLSSSTFIHINPVPGYNFAVVQFLEKYEVPHSVSGYFYWKCEQTVHASGYVYFPNSSATKYMDFEEDALQRGLKMEEGIDKVYQNYFETKIDLVIWDRKSRARKSIVLDFSSVGCDGIIQQVGNAYVGEFGLGYTDETGYIYHYSKGSHALHSEKDIKIQRQEKENVMKVFDRIAWSVLPNEQ